MNATLETIEILVKLNEEIQKYLKLLGTIGDLDPESEIWFPILVKSMGLIKTDSFMDEWDNYLVSHCDPIDKGIILNQIRKAGPAINRIRKWSGIHDFRNMVLSHNFRNKKNNSSSIFIDNSPESLDIPEHISEIILLGFCLNIATHLIKEPFKKEMDDYYSVPLDKSFRKTRLIDYIAEINDIITEISQIS